MTDHLDNVGGEGKFLCISQSLKVFSETPSRYFAENRHTYFSVSRAQGKTFPS